MIREGLSEEVTFDLRSKACTLRAKALRQHRQAPYGPGGREVKRRGEWYEMRLQHQAGSRLCTRYNVRTLIWKCEI
jgi:hypothetical protein